MSASGPCAHVQAHTLSIQTILFSPKNNWFINGLFVVFCFVLFNIGFYYNLG